ncbi:divergent polysaccharide deacetylase family protein [Paenibacillus sp. VCA1]|uniref:divergent polysaccharide deacetylase family protein n=1 Tax=Paenibacillus sp. VCA1 TaxID=3039148 RepID=UPI0028711F20|nr:divergent polysaccharide deacetylase family protein [Paenibacillus sp. VCA1]MDR9854343.1 divergent polysaccharide deacetylase family protein [Paenibacillus sp. VCA1]
MKTSNWRKRVMAAGLVLLLAAAPAFDASAHGSAGLQGPDSGIPPENKEGRKAARQSVNKEKKVAVIIDDFGNGQGGTEEMLSMPIKLTVAIMPFLPTTKSDAEQAHKKGFDVLVHMPMEPKHGNPKWLGPGAITSDMTDEEVRQKVEEAIDDVPHAIGMNNHMGSKITGDERIMSIVLKVCQERGLFFVDSKTNYHSIVGKLAVNMGMPPVANHIFLDDRHTISHITGQMKAVEARAREYGNCVTIGHVGTQGQKTAAAIKSSAAEMQGRVTFVGISDLVRDIWGWHPAPILPSNNN